MQAEYRKEWMDTYLWVLAEQGVSEDYTEKMLLHNPEGGWLEFSKHFDGGQEYYCYKITGKKALNGIYAMMSIGEHQIRRILKQIFAALDRGREYLLNENDFVLLPQYIFATLPKMEIELCYVPGYHVRLKEQMESLFEYFLNRVDYEDKKAVELLYDCYMLCVKEQGGLAEIRERIEQGEEETVEPTEKEVMTDYIESQETWEAVRQEEKKEEASNSYVSWLTDRFFHKKKKEALMVAEQREEYRAESRLQPGGEDFRSEETEGMEEKTVFLSMRKEEAQLINERTGEVFGLKKLPFYIGSVDKYADCILKEEGVSRIHCCIQKKNEEYFISDLNSTNGTYLEGKEVVPGREICLRNGAVIRIAKTEFRVKLPCH